MSLTVDADFLAAALIGYQERHKDIEARIGELRERIGGQPASSASSGATPAKRVLSAAARRRMAVAQRKRWAAARKAKAEGPNSAAPAAATKRRRLSPEGRARIIAATKRRWAKARRMARAKG
ncbi:MAG: hypothetical protein ABSC23_13685 [Bryobacteraceae bacterium]|jgi:cell division septum initiation protein DivIVA